MVQVSAPVQVTHTLSLSEAASLAREISLGLRQSAEAYSFTENELESAIAHLNFAIEDLHMARVAITEKYKKIS